MTGQIKRRMVEDPATGGLGIAPATPAAVADATFASQVYQSVERTFRGGATDLYSLEGP